MQWTPTIILHAVAALGAVLTGPVALWARLGRRPRPLLHRAMGRTWVTLMLLTAVSALGIRDYDWPNLAGFTALHLLVPYTLFGVAMALWQLRQRRIAQHRQIMQQIYIGACLVAGAFTLLPSRLLGQLLWSQWLGLV